jgi:hypothetical protein
MWFLQENADDFRGSYVRKAFDEQRTTAVSISMVSYDAHAAIHITLEQCNALQI